jgi:hypothetical protein
MPLCVCFRPQLTAQGVIDTFAGGAPFVLREGPALEAGLGDISSVAVDSAESASLSLAALLQLSFPPSIISSRTPPARRGVIRRRTQSPWARGPVCLNGAGVGVRRLICSDLTARRELPDSAPCHFASAFSGP